MNREEARKRAAGVHGEFGIPDESRISSVDQRFIEVPGTEQDTVHLVRDTRAWVVRFRHGRAWTDLAIEDRSGDVVRVERSR